MKWESIVRSGNHGIGALSFRHTFQPDDEPRQINDDKSYLLLLVNTRQRY